MSELIDAIIRGDKNNARDLILNLWTGIDLNKRDYDGYTALIKASDEGYIEIVRLLLERGANPDIKDNDGNTALILASRRYNIEIAELLLITGADPNIRDNNGDTPLMVARNRGHDDIVRLIQDHIALQRAQKNLALATTFNLRLGYDTPLGYLDYDLIRDVVDNPVRNYDPKIYLRMKDENRRDKLTKSRQRLASMRSMHSREGPLGRVRYDPSIMENISRHLSRIGPAPSVQERLMLEDRQTGSGKRSSSKKRRRRKNYTSKRFY